VSKCPIWAFSIFVSLILLYGIAGVALGIMAMNVPSSRLLDGKLVTTEDVAKRLEGIPDAIRDDQKRNRAFQVTVGFNDAVSFVPTAQPPAEYRRPSYLAGSEYEMFGQRSSDALD
jgi:hypothetical protein